VNLEHAVKYVQSAPLRCVANAMHETKCYDAYNGDSLYFSHTLLNDNLVSFAYRSIYCVPCCTAYSYTLFNRNDCIRYVVLFMSVNVLFVPVERIWVFCLVFGMVGT
jgi:hypothetical protein